MLLEGATLDTYPHYGKLEAEPCGLTTTQFIIGGPRWDVSHRAGSIAGAAWFTWIGPDVLMNR